MTHFDPIKPLPHNDASLFTKMVEEALKACRYISRHDDWTPLAKATFATQPLILRQLWQGAPATETVRAETAFGILRWAAEQLRPKGKQQWQGRQWRPYLLVKSIYFADMTFAQAAKKMGVTEAALYFTRRKALEQMAEQLKGLISAETTAIHTLNCAHVVTDVRFSRLSSQPQKVLKQIAAIATPLSQQQVGTIITADEIPSIETLRREQFLLAAQDGKVVLRPQLQAVTEAALTAAERTAYYTNAAHFHLAGKHVLVAATCWQQAQLPQQAVTLLIEYADKLIQQGQGKAVQAQSQQLLKTVLDNDAQAQLQLILGNCAIHNSHLSTAIRAYEKALMAQSTPIQAKAYYRYATALRRKNVDAALAAYRYSAELLEAAQIERPLLLTIYLEMAHIFIQEQDALEDARQTLKKASCIINSDDLVQYARLHDMLGTLAGHNGNDEDAIAHYLEAYLEAAKTQEHALLNRITHNLAMAYTWAEQFSVGQKYLEKAFELAAASDDQQMLASCHKTLGINYFFQSNFAQAIVEYEKSYTLFEQLGNASWLSALACDLTEAYASSGNSQEANRYYGIADKLINQTQATGLRDLLNTIAKQFPHVLSFTTPLNIRQKIAYEYLKQHGSINRRTYATITQTSPKTALRDLKQLVALGLILATGSGRSVCYILS